MKVGILGGGQLAQMLALEAFRLGLNPVVLAGHKHDGALSVVSPSCSRVGINKSNLKWLASQVKVISLESEFVDLALLKSSGAFKKVRPTLDTLGLCQNKLDQKVFLKKNNIPTLPFQAFKTLKGLDPQYGPVVVKKSQMGYDGKGVFIRPNLTDKELKPLLASHGDFEGYIEPLAPYKKELSVVLARSKTGEIMSFPVVETVQEGGICKETLYPARVPSAVQRRALEVAKAVIQRAKGVGVFGVEMFLLSNNDIVVNEIAPRVHNTGHWTLDGSTVSQFEQHWRAILGWPLRRPDFQSACAMVNILGEKTLKLSTQEMPQSGKIVGDARVYWYRKQGVVKGRKLGHINATASTAEKALSVARKQRKRIKI